MGAYAVLRELIRDCGGTLIEDQAGAKENGPHCAVFVGRTNIRFRLCWDKREKRACLEVLRPDGKWEVQRPEVRKKKGTSFTNLHEFFATAERLAGRRYD
jgi:hypothetical protein